MKKNILRKCNSEIKVLITAIKLVILYTGPNKTLIGRIFVGLLCLLEVLNYF